MSVRPSATFEGGGGSGVSPAVAQQPQSSFEPPVDKAPPSQPSNAPVNYPVNDPKQETPPEQQSAPGAPPVNPRTATDQKRQEAEKALNDYKVKEGDHATNFIEENGGEYETPEALQGAWEAAWATEGAATRGEAEMALNAYLAAVVKDLRVTAVDSEKKNEGKDGQQQAVWIRVQEIKESHGPEESSLLDGLVDQAAAVLNASTELAAKQTELEFNPGQLTQREQDLLNDDPLALAFVKVLKDPKTGRPVVVDPDAPNLTAPERALAKNDPVAFATLKFVGGAIEEKAGLTEGELLDHAYSRLGDLLGKLPETDRALLTVWRLGADELRIQQIKPQIDQLMQGLTPEEALSHIRQGEGEAVEALEILQTGVEGSFSGGHDLWQEAGAPYFNETTFGAMVEAIERESNGTLALQAEIIGTWLKNLAEYGPRQIADPTLDVVADQLSPELASNTVVGGDAFFSGLSALVELTRRPDGLGKLDGGRAGEFAEWLTSPGYALRTASVTLAISQGYGDALALAMVDRLKTENRPNAGRFEDAVTRGRQEFLDNSGGEQAKAEFEWFDRSRNQILQANFNELLAGEKENPVYSKEWHFSALQSVDREAKSGAALGLDPDNPNSGPGRPRYTDPAKLAQIRQVESWILEAGGERARVTFTPAIYASPKYGVDRLTLVRVIDENGEDVIIDASMAVQAARGQNVQWKYDNFTDYQEDNELDDSGKLYLPRNMLLADADGDKNADVDFEGVDAAIVTDWERWRRVGDVALGVAGAAAGAALMFGTGGLGAMAIVSVGAAWGLGRSIETGMEMSEGGQSLSPYNPNADGAWLGVVDPLAGSVWTGGAASMAGLAALRPIALTRAWIGEAAKYSGGALVAGQSWSMAHAGMNGQIDLTDWSLHSSNWDFALLGVGIGSMGAGSARNRFDRANRSKAAPAKETDAGGDHAGDQLWYPGKAGRPVSDYIVLPDGARDRVIETLETSSEGHPDGRGGHAAQAPLRGQEGIWLPGNESVHGGGEIWTPSQIHVVPSATGQVPATVNALYTPKRSRSWEQGSEEGGPVKSARPSAAAEGQEPPGFHVTKFGLFAPNTPKPAVNITPVGSGQRGELRRIGVEAQNARRRSIAANPDAAVAEPATAPFKIAFSSREREGMIRDLPRQAFESNASGRLWLFRHSDLTALQAAVAKGEIPLGANIHVVQSAKPGAKLTHGAILGGGQVKAGGRIAWNENGPAIALDGDIHFAVTNLNADEVRVGLKNSRGLPYALYDGESGWLSPSRVKEIFDVGEGRKLFNPIAFEGGTVWRPKNAYAPSPDHARVYRGRDIEALYDDLAIGRIPPGRHVYLLWAGEPDSSLSTGSILATGTVGQGGDRIAWSDNPTITLDNDILFVVSKKRPATIAARKASGEGFGEYAVYDPSRGWIPHPEIVDRATAGVLRDLFRPESILAPDAARWSPSQTPSVRPFTPKTGMIHAQTIAASDGPQQLYYTTRPPVLRAFESLAGQDYWPNAGLKEAKNYSPENPRGLTGFERLADRFGENFIRRIHYTEASYADFYARASDEVKAQFPEPGAFNPDEMTRALVELPGGLEVLTADIHAHSMGYDRRADGRGPRRWKDNRFESLLEKVGDHGRILFGSIPQFCGGDGHYSTANPSKADMRNAQDLDLRVVEDFYHYYAENPKFVAKADLSLTGLEFAPTSKQIPVAYATRMMLEHPGRFNFIGEVTGVKELVARQLGSNAWEVETPKFLDYLEFATETGQGVLLHNDWGEYSESASGRPAAAKQQYEHFDKLIQVFGQERFRKLNIVFAHTGIGRYVRPDEAMVTREVTVVRWDHQNNRALGTEKKTISAPEHIHRLYQLFEKVPNARADISWNDVAQAYADSPNLREGLIAFVLDNQDRLLFGTDTVKPANTGQYNQALNTGLPIFGEIARRDPGALWKLMRGNYEEVMENAETRVHEWTRDRLLEQRADPDLAGDAAAKSSRMDEIRDTLAGFRAENLEGAWQDYQNWLDKLAMQTGGVKDLPAEPGVFPTLYANLPHSTHQHIPGGRTGRRTSGGANNDSQSRKTAAGVGTALGLAGVAGAEYAVVTNSAADPFVNPTLPLLPGDNLTMAGELNAGAFGARGAMIALKTLYAEKVRLDWEAIFEQGHATRDSLNRFVGRLVKAAPHLGLTSDQLFQLSAVTEQYWSNYQHIRDLPLDLARGWTETQKFHVIMAKTGEYQITIDRILGMQASSINALDARAPLGKLYRFGTLSTYLFNDVVTADYLLSGGLDFSTPIKATESSFMLLFGLGNAFFTAHNIRSLAGGFAGITAESTMPMKWLQLAASSTLAAGGAVWTVNDLTAAWTEAVGRNPDAGASVTHAAFAMLDGAFTWHMAKSAGNELSKITNQPMQSPLKLSTPFYLLAGALVARELLALGEEYGDEGWDEVRELFGAG